MSSEQEPTAEPEYAQRMVRLSRAGVKRLLPVQAPYRAHVRRVCRGRVLDVGCGIGRNLAHLGDRAVGVDHNASAVDIARTRGLRAHLTEDFAESADGVPGSYDTVLIAHVLEHMSAADGHMLLTTYLHYLRPGGRVVLICPQERGYRSDPTHVRFLDLNELAGVCRRSGLLVRRQYSFPFPRPVGRVFPYNEFVLVADKARVLLA